MYALSKRALSQFVRSECRRRLRLDLYADTESRAAARAPDRDTQRPGLALLVAQGREFEREKFAELEAAFPDKVRHGAQKDFEPGEETAFAKIKLEDHLPTARDNSFLVEAEYEVLDRFVRAHGLEDIWHALEPGDHAIRFAGVRPDIIHVMAPTGTAREAITVEGGILKVAAEDRRQGLRIIDVKLAGEPSPSHFAELAYYGMTLAGWLEDKGLSDDFLVLKDAAIWPGKHEASELRRVETDMRRLGRTAPDADECLKAWQNDLEVIPAEVVLGRTRKFLKVDLREVLAEPDWTRLPFHVDTSCSGCDYLGYSWKSLSEDELAGGGDGPTRCWADAAAARHLSLIMGLSRGASGKLRLNDVAKIDDLAALRPTNPIFDQHQKLSAGRTLFRSRSAAIAGTVEAAIPERSGTSAVLPKFSDVQVALSVDYDVGSGITFAIGYSLTARYPAERLAGPKKYRWEAHRPDPRVMLVESKSFDDEREVFVAMMRHLVSDLREAAVRVETAYERLRRGTEKPHKATGQIYLWDQLNLEHLRRVMGRHLLAVIDAPAKAGSEQPAPMAWMFPPETVIEDADLSSRNSPITVVGEAVRSLLAADIPHHYSLLSVANAYAPSWFKAEDGKAHFRVRRLFVDPLSDQIPSERGHEIWNRRSPYDGVDWQGYRDIVRGVVKTRLRALMAVKDRLVEDLSSDPIGLTAQAPQIGAILGTVTPLGGIARDSNILHQHARLMVAAAKLDNELLMALPPYQREATFQSIRVESRLDGAERSVALSVLGLGALDGNADAYVFRISHRSRQAKPKTGDRGLSLMPEDRLPIQHLSVYRFKETYPQVQAYLGPPDQRADRWKTVRDMCEVTILGFDRLKGVIAVAANTTFLPAVVGAGFFDLNVDGSAGRFAVLDPLSNDSFVRWRLRPALEAIRTPPLSKSRPLFLNENLTRLDRVKPRVRPSVPAERFIWDADVLSLEETGDDAEELLAEVRGKGNGLTPKQEEAVRRSVERRLALLWGPPGTGKSTTAVALLRGLLWRMREGGRPLRICITGPTWVAIETVARKLPGIVEELGMTDSVVIARLSSYPVPPGSIDAALANHVVLTRGEEEHEELVARLEDRSQITVVAGTCQQLGRLTNDRETPMRPFFDLMLVDEASQMSVAQAVVAFATLADDARLTVVGDHLQMSPIQPIEPPKGAEHLVGSLYDFFRDYRKGEGGGGIVPVMLDRSFRSNREIVEFVRLAGYGDELQAVHGNLRMRLGRNPAPSAPDFDFLSDMDVCLATLLDPARPLVALVHSDEYSSQRNDPEADLVAAIVLSLKGRLLGETGDEPLSGVKFYEDGIGIVTPHRAQQGAVVERLMPACGTDGAEADALVRAVDTVERFQGQEKTVMVASFGLGDTDQIASEEEFLYSLNRFNVIASRAKAKLIVVLSRKLVDYLPRDPDTLRASRLLKHYADGHLPSLGTVSLPGLGSCELKGR